MNELVKTARRMVPSLSRDGESVAVVYLLKLKSGVIYTGCTTDLEARLNAHATGRAGRTTHFDPPIAVLRIETFPDFTAARRREAQLKRWSRAKKEALIAGDAKPLQQLSKSRKLSLTQASR